MTTFRVRRRGATLVEMGLVLVMIVIACAAALTALGGAVSDTYTSVNDQVGSSGEGGGGEPTPEPTPEPTIGNLFDWGTGAEGRGDGRTFRISPYFDPYDGSTVHWDFTGGTAPASVPSRTGVHCDGVNADDDVAPTAESSHSLAVPTPATSCFVYIWAGGVGYSDFYSWDAGSSTYTVTEEPPAPTPPHTEPLLASGVVNQPDVFGYRITPVFDPLEGTAVVWKFEGPNIAATDTRLRCDGVDYADEVAPNGTSYHEVTAPLGATSCYVYLRHASGYSYIQYQPGTSWFGYTP